MVISSSAYLCLVAVSFTIAYLTLTSIINGTEHWRSSTEGSLSPVSTDVGFDIDANDLSKNSSKKTNRRFELDIYWPLTPIVYPEADISALDLPRNISERLIERFVVLPNHRLLFCMIEKNANTAFGWLFNKVKRDSRYPMNVKQPQNSKKHNPYNYNMTIYEISILLANSSWSKAVFYREPLNRFLSAYRSKCEAFDQDGNMWCDRAMHMKNDTATFGKAVQYIQSLDSIYDPHFARQAEFCGGLSTTLHLFKHVYELHPSRVRHDLSEVFESTDLPFRDNRSSFGKSYNGLFPLPDEYSSEDGRGFLPKRRGSKGNTFSSNTQTLLQYYSRQCYIRVVVDFYQADYDVFNISYPEWARAALANTSGESCRGLTY
jgi:hypothetical protein